MLRNRANDRSVIAVMGQDGKVYFDFQQVAKPPFSWRLPDWMSVSLSLVAVAVLAAIALIA